MRAAWLFGLLLTAAGASAQADPLHANPPPADQAHVDSPPADSPHVDSPHADSPPADSPPPAAAPVPVRATRRDPPRWRLRASLLQGFGGGRTADDAIAARFPTSLELGARLWGPLSLAATVTGTLAGELDAGCGQPVRPNAIAGSVGIRADLANGRSAPWIDPWVEAHGGVGAQAGARAVPGGCPQAVTYGSAGARLGLDTWLGRAAVTVAVAIDYLPLGVVASAVLGGTFILY